jgi:hypothetical protein
MSSTVKNIGVVEMTKGILDTKKAGQYGGTGDAFTDSVGGTVRVVLGGIEYVWGPNDSKTLPNDVATEAVAASGSRLRIIDTRDGVANATGKGVS